MLKVVLLVIVLVTIIGLCIWYFVRNKIYTPSTKEGDEPVNSVFSFKTETKSISRSKYFPDTWFQGQMFKLDTVLKYLVKNPMFKFPENAMIMKDFRYFDVDGNPFEEIVVDSQSKDEYLIMYDAAGEQVFMLNKVASLVVDPAGDPPAMVSEEVLSLTENDITFEYTDMTGLIRVVLQDGFGSRITERLIRVYERTLDDDETEVTVCIMDSKTKVDYYVGLIISRIQLETD